MALAASMTALCLAAPSAVAQTRLQVATLTCRLPAGTGSRVEPRNVRCSSVNSRGRTERYSGTVTQFAPGAALAAGGAMRWSVRTTTRVTRRGALAGDYAEAGAGASKGTGSGAKALIGGPRRSITLRPLAVRSSSARARSGADLTTGVTRLVLR
jgi:hypothetical protein